MGNTRGATVLEAVDHKVLLMLQARILVLEQKVEELEKALTLMETD
jgi:hypothetical protein